MVDGDTFLRERRHRPRFESIVLSVKFIRLPRRTKISTELNPRMRAPHQVGTRCQIRVDTDESGFMDAKRYEKAIPPRTSGSQHAHALEPASKAATMLTRALPPAAAWRADDQWPKAWVAPGNARRHLKACAVLRSTSARR
jgi:hypothetical protein